MAQSNQKTKRGDRTRVSKKQIDDLTAAMRDALDKINSVKESMEKHQMSEIAPTNYASGLKGLKDFTKFAGEIMTSFWYELGIRTDEGLMAKVAESIPDYEAQSSTTKKASKRKS